MTMAIRVEPRPSPIMVEPSEEIAHQETLVEVAVSQEMVLTEPPTGDNLFQMEVKEEPILVITTKADMAAVEPDGAREEAEEDIMAETADLQVIWEVLGAEVLTQVPILKIQQDSRLAMARSL